MDRNTAKLARAALNNAIGSDPINGFTVEVQNGSFNASEVTFKVTMRKEGTKSQAEAMAEEFAKIEGFKMTNAKGDKIVAYKHRSPKFPWIVQKASGGQYKYTDKHMVAEGFKA